MSAKCFTDAEKQSLLQVPYTLKVTDKTINFTLEFKKRFWAMYQDGYTPRKILEELGYDLSLFSNSRLTSIHASIKRSAKAGFPEVKEGRQRLSHVNMQPDEETLILMQKELLYQRQLLEFLKKTAMLAKSGKRRKS